MLKNNMLPADFADDADWLSEESAQSAKSAGKELQ